MKQKCDNCQKERINVKTAVFKGSYYKAICSFCLGDIEDDISGGAASYDRRRGYEDMAQDTVQPYDANGANPEFLRLYPEQAHKVFNSETLEKLKRKI